MKKPVPIVPFGLTAWKISRLEQGQPRDFLTFVHKTDISVVVAPRSVGAPSKRQRWEIFLMDSGHLPNQAEESVAVERAALGRRERVPSPHRGRKGVNLAPAQPGWPVSCSNGPYQRKGSEALLGQCLASALHYANPTQWKLKDTACYNAASRAGWLEACTAHMVRLKAKKVTGSLRGVPRKWTPDACLKEARRHQSAAAWAKASPGSVSAAKASGIYQLCTEGMAVKIRRVLTEATCREIATLYGSTSAWIKNDRSSYEAARSRGWLPQCTQHMVVRKSKEITLELCLEEASKYATSGDWKRGDIRTYNAAASKGWLSHCRQHLQLLGHKIAGKSGHTEQRT